MTRVKFDTVNTASYSPRPNTPAASWANQITEEIICSSVFSSTNYYLCLVQLNYLCGMAAGSQS